MVSEQEYNGLMMTRVPPVPGATTPESPMKIRILSGKQRSAGVKFQGLAWAIRFLGKALKGDLPKTGAALKVSRSRLILKMAQCQRRSWLTGRRVPRFQVWYPHVRWGTCYQGIGRCCGHKSRERNFSAARARGTARRDK